MKEILKPINVKQLTDNFFRKLDDDWMLVTAGDKDSFNTMTASWGTFGILWNKPVSIAFIRPSRYTFEFINKHDYYTLSFFSEEHRDALDFCGNHSGRNTDKIQKTGLTPVYTEKGNVYFAQARLMIECKKLYSDDIKASSFLDKGLIEKIYPNADFHRFFIGDIVNCLASKEYFVEKGINFAKSEDDNSVDF
jgi:flavin reductase (DIM6/NTAB) family NADH-FMN oxidoreductase RutF